MDFSSAGSSKRVRMPGSGSQVPSCLVDGCFSDLSKCRDYHRRHKVCEPHSKAAKVFIKGVEQRFCQQCSRFHSLTEFDEGKRSCRKRLEGHNRRRRKSQPDPLSANSPRLFSNHQGTRYIHFGDSTIYTTSSPTTAALSGVVKVEDDPMIYSSQTSLNFSDGKSHFPGSSSNKGKDHVRQFPFLQGTTTPMFPGDSVGQANLEANAIFGGGPKMFSEGLTRVVDSNRALSLLSSPPQAESTQEINVNPASQSLISSLNYDSMGVESQHLGSVMVPNMSSNANIHPHIMFHLLPDGSSSSGSQQKVSFNWK